MNKTKGYNKRTIRGEMSIKHTGDNAMSMYVDTGVLWYIIVGVMKNLTRAVN